MRNGKWGNRKGQSTLEYLLIAAVVIAAIAIAAGTVIKPAVESTMTNSSTAITGAADKLSAALQ